MKRKMIKLDEPYPHESDEDTGYSASISDASHSSIECQIKYQEELLKTKDEIIEKQIELIKLLECRIEQSFNRLEKAVRRTPRSFVIKVDFKP